MGTTIDLIAIAQDIAQESCYYIPIANPERIVQRRYVFEAARVVKEMCKAADGKGKVDVASTVLYGALVVEYAAKFEFSAKSSMSESRRVLDELEEITDTLKSMAPEDSDDFESETYMSGLLDALADDLGVSEREVRQSIESSFERHKGGSQVKFLDILEQVARNDSVATPDEKRLYQTYLRRLSYRSEKLPSTFHLSDVKIFPCEPKQCAHSSPGVSQQSLVGGFGKVDRAKWRKPGGTVVEVAIKDLRDHDQRLLCHEAAFWYYLDPNKVVPFYGVAVIDSSPCLVSLWMDGGRICCYVDGKNDSIRLDLLRQVANGIKYLHDLNFVHCDIKPANILIDTRKAPKALITDFGCSNTARRTNVDYSRMCGYTPGYVRDINDITPWDPSSDVYAFAVTCCQVVLVNRRQDIASIPQDIGRCISQPQQKPVQLNLNGEGSKGTHIPIIQGLRRKFFPIKKKSPPPFFEEIFCLVANTCIPMCKMDDAINLLERAKPDIEEAQPSVEETLENDDAHDAVLQLMGHEAEVFVCAWNPTQYNILSSGSKDAVVNLWDLPLGSVKAKSIKPYQTIDCSSAKVDADLTSLDWNCHGTLLSVGSYDAALRIYTDSAELYFESRLHKGPIFATRFSRDGKWLATASLDNTVCLWDVEKKQRHMQYKHRGLCLDLDWLDEELFASCSADKVIHVLSVNHAEPVAILTGHDGEVNQVKANPSGTRLMSCSDDMTLRIWDITRAKQSSGSDQVSISGKMTVLEGHSNWVTTVSWSPVKLANGHELVASSSFDTTARLWDADTGTCLQVFTHHNKPIYTISFSPDGRWLATGGGDGWFHLYDATEKVKVWSWISEHKKRAIFEMSWQQHEGGVDRVALSLQSHKVGLIDLNHLMRIPALQKTHTAS